MIIKNLNGSEYVKGSEFEEILHVSNKTVRKMISDLNSKLQTDGASIDSKTGKGYHLTVNDANQFAQLFLPHDSLQDELEMTDRSIAEKLIETDEYLKIDDLADSLYMSSRAVSKAIGEAEQIFAKNEMKLERKPHYGIRLLGSEYRRRVCMTSILLDRKGFEIDKRVSLIVDYIFIKNEIDMSSAARESFLIYLQYSLQRIREEKMIGFEKEERKFEERDFFQESLTVSEDLCTMLSDEFEIHISNDEKYAIALEISDKRYYRRESGSLYLDKEVSDLIEDMFRSIKSTYGLSFENDLETYAMLLNHMIPLRLRIINHTELKNPLLDEIRMKYPFAMSVATGTNSLMEKYFHQKVSEDELSYIAIAIQLAIEKQKKRKKRKKNILIVCASGSINSRLFEYQFLEMFGDSIGICQICSFTSLLGYNFSDIDYVFTTVPIDIKLPAPVYNLSEDIISNRVSAEIKKRLSLDKEILTDKFSPDLFMTHRKDTDKSSLLKAMCERVCMTRKVPDTFYDLVMKREEMLDTSYDGLVALPHPYCTVTGEPLICTALLDEPLDWGKHKVKAVFLVAVSKEIKDLEEFYDKFFDFIMNKENIRNLLNEQTYTKLIELVEKN